ncbi:hypothetical protein Pst134EA_007064 [Puccinia striiformis f. sp. tritici]|uniref:hypothetical protein n=1 Tax=Puccinia striiformis f. sp. tritici TaxID=168172 RepID=UPI002008CA2E|nr:hypothetical protein Pst134EA_007064 [Puccinia striiformis f. sp. tritici]KAH9469787.1 hypothetical protein Pst134EA_007064 [Puccinia striiformis f. sp. tritici]
MGSSQDESLDVPTRPAFKHPDLISSISRPVGDEIPCCPLYEFLFSNPFHRESPIITRSPSAATRAHHIPIIPPQQAIFVDTDDPQDSLTWLQLRQRSLAVGYHLNHDLRLHASSMVPSNASDPSLDRSSGLLSPVIMLHLANGTFLVTMLLGTLAAGLTVTMVNPSYTCHELVDVLQASKPALIVTSSSGLDAMLNALALLQDPQLRSRLIGRMYIAEPRTVSRTTSRLSQKSHIAQMNAPNGQMATLIDWSTLLQPPPPGTNYQPFQFTESTRESRLRIAAIIWSSGTGGKSKGVLCSHHAMVYSIIAFWHQKLDYGPDERTIGLVPFYHIMGLQAIILFSIAAGSTVYIMQKFEPRRYLEEITKNRISSLQIAPPIAAFLANSPLLDDTLYDLSSVRNSMSGGARLAPEIVTKVFRRCGILVKSGYGLSEAGHVANQVGVTPADLLPQLGTVGQVMYGVELRIIPVGAFKQLASRQSEGEILIRSPSLMIGYLDNPLETSQVLDQEGWLHTGDLGFLDGFGRLCITGRLKEIIMVKGFQVSPSDLETLISKIKAVGEVAVTSFYCDDQATEFPRAYVVPQGDDLAALCEIVSSGHQQFRHHPRHKDLIKLALQIKELVESQMVHYKWLRGNIILTSHIPKSPSGKVLKRILSTIQGIEIPLYPGQKSYSPNPKL